MHFGRLSNRGTAPRLRPILSAPSTRWSCRRCRPSIRSPRCWPDPIGLNSRLGTYTNFGQSARSVRSRGPSVDAARWPPVRDYAARSGGAGCGTGRDWARNLHVCYRDCRSAPLIIPLPFNWAKCSIPRRPPGEIPIYRGRGAHPFPACRSFSEFALRGRPPVNRTTQDGAALSPPAAGRHQAGRSRSNCAWLTPRGSGIES